MEILICKNEECNNPVPESRRLGSVYCTPECGWTHRNHLKRQKNEEKLPHSRRIDLNHKIIRKLYSKGVFDVSIESLELLGYDFEYYTSVEDFDSQKRISKFKLFEFIIALDNNRCRIKKATL